MLLELERTGEACAPRQGIPQTWQPRPSRAARVDSNVRSSGCSTRPARMPNSVSAQELAPFDSIVSTTRTVKRGEALYRADDEFHSIYSIRAGSFKSVVMHRDGREQVTGFYLAGEVLGLDGVCNERHGSDAVALEDSSVCVISYALLEAMCAESKPLQQQLMRTMSGEIVRESSLMMLLGTMSAEERVAAFLINLSGRMKARGYSPAEFNLRMTREEMGNYLGMKLETVSRMFSKFQRDGLLETHGKQIRIVDLDALARI